MDILIWHLLVPLFILILNAGAVIVIIIVLAGLGWWFFSPPRGTIVFKNKGSDLEGIWDNVSGHKLSGAQDPDGKRWLVIEKDGKKIESSRFHGNTKTFLRFHRFLWNRFGIRFISPYWPQVYINEFIVDRRRLIEIEKGGLEKKAYSLSDRVVKSPNAGIPVNHLLFVSFRPVYKEGVELAGDNSKINLLLLPTWQVVSPVIPIYYYMGNFYPLLDGAIEAAIEDFFATHRVAVYRKKHGEEKSNEEDGEVYEGEEGEFAHDTYDPESCLEFFPSLKENKEEALRRYKKTFAPSPLTYSHWIKTRKAGNSPIERHLITFNATEDYYNRIEEALQEAKDEVQEAEKARLSKKEREDKKAVVEGMEGILRQLKHLTRGIYEKEKTEEEKTKKEKKEETEKTEEQIDRKIMEESKKQKLAAKGLGEGIIPSVGYALIAFKLVDWEPHEDTKELASALQAKQTERHTAQGVIAKHEGLKKAAVLLGEGESEALSLKIKAQTDLGVNQNVASETVREIDKSANIGGEHSKVTHWFEKSGDRGHPPIAISSSPPHETEKKRSTEPPAKKEDSPPEEKLDL